MATKEDGVAGPLSETTSVAAAADADSDAEDRPATLIAAPAAPDAQTAAQANATAEAAPPPTPPPPAPPPPAPAVEQVPLRASSARISEVLNSDALIDKIAAARNHEELANTLAACSSWEYVRMPPRERAPARLPTPV